MDPPELLSFRAPGLFEILRWNREEESAEVTAVQGLQQHLVQSRSQTSTIVFFKLSQDEVNIKVCVHHG